MNDLLKVSISDNKIHISIGIDALCHAISFNDYFHELRITDKQIFASAVADYLSHEIDETGMTVLHEAFDAAAIYAVEDGCEGVEEV